MVLQYNTAILISFHSSNLSFKINYIDSHRDCHLRHLRSCVMFRTPPSAMERCNYIWGCGGELHIRIGAGITHTLSTPLHTYVWDKSSEEVCGEPHSTSSRPLRISIWSDPSIRCKWRVDDCVDRLDLTTFFARQNVRRYKEKGVGETLELFQVSDDLYL